MKTNLRSFPRQGGYLLLCTLFFLSSASRPGLLFAQTKNEANLRIVDSTQILILKWNACEKATYITLTRSSCRAGANSWKTDYSVNLPAHQEYFHDEVEETCYNYRYELTIPTADGKNVKQIGFVNFNPCGL